MKNLQKDSILIKFPVNQSNILVGAKVIDDDDNTGVIESYEDLHNVLVKYDDGGSGLHCLVKGCVEYKEINGKTFEVPQYDPLYYYEKRI